MLRIKELGLSFDEIDMLTMGDVLDMMIEQGNDYEEWDYLPTQEDIDRLMR